MAIDLAFEQNPSMGQSELVDIAMQSLPPNTPHELLPTKSALVIFEINYAISKNLS